MEFLIALSTEVVLRITGVKGGSNSEYKLNYSEFGQVDKVISQNEPGKKIVDPWKM